MLVWETCEVDDSSCLCCANMESVGIHEQLACIDEEWRSLRS